MVKVLDMKTDSFFINSREISPEYSPYIIAEVSANHNDDIDRALKLWMTKQSMI